MNEIHLNKRNINFIIFSLAIGSFAIGIGEYTSMGLLLEISKGLGISEIQTGNSISSYALGVVVGAPVCAYVSNKFNKKKCFYR